VWYENNAAESGIQILGNIAISMGNVYLADYQGDEIRPLSFAFAATNSCVFAFTSLLCPTLRRIDQTGLGAATVTERAPTSN
jgi:hypothetical protein